MAFSLLHNEGPYVEVAATARASSGLNVALCLQASIFVQKTSALHCAAWQWPKNVEAPDFQSGERGLQGPAKLALLWALALVPKPFFDYHSDFLYPRP